MATAVSRTRRMLLWLSFAGLLAALFMGVGVYLGDAHRHAIRDVMFQVFRVGLPSGEERADAVTSHDGAAGPLGSQAAAGELDAGIASAPAVADAAQAIPASVQAVVARILDAGAEEGSWLPPDRSTVSPPSPGAARAGEPALPKAPKEGAQQRDKEGAAVSSVSARPDGPAEPPPVAPTSAEPQPSAPAAPAGADLLAMPVTVRVQVVVDEPFVHKHADWLAQVQRTIALASEALRLSARVDLDLVGVVRFGEPLAGLSIDALGARLRDYRHGHVEIVLGFVDRPFSSGRTACPSVAADAPRNGGYGIIGPAPASAPDYLPGTLQCLGQLLGAALVQDAASEAYRAGSWMRLDWQPQAGKTPWLDPDNRARIMRRKGLPFGEAP